MYFCGALKVIGNNKKTKEVVDKLAKQYPVFIEQQILDMIYCVLSNEYEKVINKYEALSIIVSHIK